MATMDAYGPRFIGNDMVAPRVRPKKVSVAPARRIQPQRRVAPAMPAQTSAPAPVRRPMPMVAASAPAPVAAADIDMADVDLDAQPAEAVRARKSIPKPSTRMSLIALSVIVLAAAAVVAVPHASAMWRTVSSDLHHTSPGSFKLPAHSLLVKNSVLPSYVDAIESQTITVNIDGATVTPTPPQIAKWFTQSAGPEKSATLLTVDTSAIESSLSTAMQSNSSSSGEVDPTAIAQATNQIARSLLTYKGISITLPSNNS